MSLNVQDTPGVHGQRGKGRVPDSRHLQAPYVPFPHVIDLQSNGEIEKLRTPRHKTQSMDDD